MIFRTLFLLLSTLGVLAALGTVLTRNLVHAALCLVGFFFIVACQFLFLDAEFLAAIQVLIYIGAVAILLLFGIMLTRNIQGDETTGGPWIGKLPAAAASLAVLGGLIFGMLDGGGVGGGPNWASQSGRPSLNPISDPRRAESIREGMAMQVGFELMTRYLVPFELAGLLLTAAVVGAVALAHPEVLAEQSPGVQARRRPESPVESEGDGPAAGVEPLSTPDTSSLLR